MNVCKTQTVLSLLMVSFFATGCWMSSEVRNDPLFEPSDNNIYSAAEAGDLEAVQALMYTPAWDPNLTDQEGYLPLSCAAKGGNLDIIYLMVADGADVNLSDNRGKTPLEYAREAGHEDAVLYLQELGATE